MIDPDETRLNLKKLHKKLFSPCFNFLCEKLQKLFSKKLDIIAISVLINVLSQTAVCAISIKRYEMPKSIVKPITPTITNLIKEEYWKIYNRVSNVYCPELILDSPSRRSTKTTGISETRAPIFNALSSSAT